ncbi:MAG: hypothetical protein WCK01_05310 [Candidatus Uhrbacteria bacterium]
MYSCNKPRTISSVLLGCLFTSFVTFLPVSHVLAVDDIPLVSLTTTLSEPVFSADWDTNPSYTNVKYSWALTQGVTAPSDDTCVALNTGTCLLVNVDLQDTAPTSTHLGQEWMGTLSLGDFTLDGPANSSISHVQRVDNDGNGRFNSLEIQIGCSAACAFATGTVYSITIVNSPIKNPVSVGIPGAYSTLSQWVGIQDGTDAPANTPESITSLVVIGKGLTVTANVDPILTFSVGGFGLPASYYGESVSIDNSAAPDTCDFGVLSPTSPKVCAWYLNIATNASNGYSIYVVQDQDMTFNGNSIKQFKDGTRIDDAAATEWTVPASVQLAHLGYSSNDADIFPPAGGTVAVWAGIPTVAAADAAPVATGLVASNNLPESHQYTYAIKIESAATLPQGTGYTHHEYFMVVGNF